MELEASNSSLTFEAWLSELDQDLNSKFDQLIKYEQTEINNEKDRIKSFIMNFYSKVFSVTNQKFIGSFDPSKLTPCRGNLFLAYQLLSNITDEDELLKRRSFIDEFWTLCDCS